MSCERQSTISRAWGGEVVKDYSVKTACESGGGRRTGRPCDVGQLELDRLVRYNLLTHVLARVCVSGGTFSDSLGAKQLLITRRLAALATVISVRCQ